jgi:hypothetical protein
MQYTIVRKQEGCYSNFNQVQTTKRSICHSMPVGQASEAVIDEYTVLGEE